VERSANILRIPCEKDAALAIAQRSRGVPRIANRLLRRCRDYADVRSDGRLSLEVAQAALNALRIDELGLTEMDRKLMRIVIDHGPVGLNSLSAQLSEEPDVIEVCESFLMLIGFLARTASGRIATQKGIQYFKGVTTPKAEFEEMIEWTTGQFDLLGARP